MTGALLIAARELAERRTVLIAALVAGCLPFASPLFPGVRIDQAADARDAMALILAVSFSLGVALLLGATIVGRDLSEGRLGFDFSRPLGGGAIWAGRFLGALVTTLLVLAVVVLPTSLVGGGVFSSSLGDLVRPWSLALLGAVLVLLPLVHVVSIAFRSRSAWLGVDMVSAVVVLLVIGVAARRLFNAFAIGDLRLGLLVVGVVAILALWIASAVQVAGGRTDLRRGHRLQSIVLWSALIGTVVCFDGSTRWVVSADPGDLTSAFAVPAGRGDWAIVGGEARGRGDFAPAFLMDAGTGRFIRLGPALSMGNVHNALFSADGRRAVWLKVSGPRDLRTDTFFADLDRPEPRPREALITFSNPWIGVALSEDGRRLAALADGLLSVYELESGRILGSAKVAGPEKNGRPVLFFAGADRVRVVVFEHGIEIYEYQISSKRMEKTGEGSSVFARPSLSFDRRHDRILVRDLGGSRGSEMLDGRSGATLATFPTSEGGTKRQGHRFLNDGRIVFAERAGEATRLRVVSVEGQERSSIDLPVSGEEVWLGGEASPGKLIVAHGPRGPHVAGEASTILLVDVDTGEVREIARGLFPLMAFWRGTEVPAPGGAAARLFQSGDAVVYLDPIAGERSVLAGLPPSGSMQ